MKATKTFRAMDRNQLESKIDELTKELMKINAQVAAGTTPKNPGQIKQMKKNIARIKTILKTK